MAGWTTSAGDGSANAYVFKTDASGGLLWEWNLYLNIENWAYDVLECPDGGYLVVGWAYYGEKTGKNIYIAKTKADGSMEFESSCGLYKDEGAYSV